ncbi:MAG: exodeoxyribonuclease III [Thermodesulfobacteriota bacterium]
MIVKLASFNANGIRARLPVILAWLEKERPDVLSLQETKVQDSDFPKGPFEEKGYYCTYRGEKSYNGVAVLSRNLPEDVRFGFDDSSQTEGTRLVSLKVEGIHIVNSYIPQGQVPNSEKFRYKLDWLKRLHEYFVARFNSAMPVVWTGDFNIAPEPMDVYDPVALLGSIGYHPAEHSALSVLKKWGFVDVFRKHQPEVKAFTFWDYRIPNAVKRGLGWRIDHIWATPRLAEKSLSAWVDREVRLMERPSDHTFIAAEFDLTVG